MARELCVRIDEKDGSPVLVHLPNTGRSGFTTACGICDPSGWDVDQVDEQPTCEVCIEAVVFFRNLRLIDGSLPR